MLFLSLQSDILHAHSFVTIHYKWTVLNSTGDPKTSKGMRRDVLQRQTPTPSPSPSPEPLLKKHRHKDKDKKKKEKKHTASHSCM